MQIKHLLVLIIMLSMGITSLYGTPPETKTQIATRWGKGLGYACLGTAAMGIPTNGIAILVQRRGYVYNNPPHPLIGLSLLTTIPFIFKIFKKSTEQFTKEEKNTLKRIPYLVSTAISALAAINGSKDLYTDFNHMKSTSSGLYGSSHYSISRFSGLAW